MAKNLKLNLNVGDGLGFTPDGKLTVRFVGDNIRIVDDEGSSGSQGLYVDPLNGVAGTVPDNWTTVTGPGSKLKDAQVTPSTISNFIDMDRAVVNLIFTYGLYQIAGRSDSVVNYNPILIKRPIDIVNEMNFPLDQNGQNRTSFRPNASELLQLVINSTFRTVISKTGGNIATEDGTRAGNNSMTTKVLFMIKSITYLSDENPQENPYWVKSITLLCLYSEVAEYVVGREYSSQQ